MLAKVAERIRSSTSFHAIAHCVIAELGHAALVLCDAAGEPTLWIGDAGIDRDFVHAYLDGGYRDDALFAQARETFVPQCDDDTWVGPILGGDGVIGMLRVMGPTDRTELTTIAAYVSIRIAILGLSLEDARSVSSLTPRQREVAELVAHGCTNIEIARMLAISPHAVKKHVSRVLAVLEVSNRTELAALTGRWRMASGTDQDLPLDVQIVLRNPPKLPAQNVPKEVA